MNLTPFLVSRDRGKVHSDPCLVFATLKLELLDDRPFKDREAARSAVFKYVELFYNRTRMHSALGYRSPMQAEREYQPVRFVS